MAEFYSARSRGRRPPQWTIIAPPLTDWEQISNEPIVNLDYGSGIRFFAYEPDGTWNMEVMPRIGASIGNMLTYGSFGATVRLGDN